MKCPTSSICVATVLDYLGQPNASQFVVFFLLFVLLVHSLHILKIQAVPAVIFESVAERKEMLLQLWGNSSDNYLIWNWLCSFICTQQTTLYLQTDILFRGTITVQRLLGGKIHVFHTAVGIKLLCGCLINNNWVKGTSSLLSGIVIIFYYYYFFSVQTHYLSVHESKFF